MKTFALMRMVKLQNILINTKTLGFNITKLAFCSFFFEKYSINNHSFSQFYKHIGIKRIDEICASGRVTMSKM